MFIGLISYTWYLWHWPLLSIARNIRGGSLPNNWICSLLLIIGLVLSIFSYFIIETPIRRKKITKALTLNLALSVLCCAMLGVIVNSFNGFPWRLGEAASAAESMKNSFPARDKYAEEKFLCSKDMNYCWAPKGSDPTIALIGDSHAHHLASGLQKNLNKPFLLIGQAGTPPVIDLICLRHEKKSEEPLMTQALKIVNEDTKIKTVVLSSRWSLFTHYKHVPYLWLSEKGENNRLKVLETLLSRTIEELLKNKKKVIILLDVPKIPLNPKNCVKTRPIQLSSSKCSFSESKSKKIEGLTNETIMKVAKKYPSVIVYDPSKALCSQGVCSIGNNNSIYYHDESHLTDKGSELVAKNILQHIKL